MSPRTLCALVQLTNVSVTKRDDGRWEVRWRVAGRGSPRRKRIFDRKTDADRFETEVRRRKALGELGLFEQRNRSVEDLAKEWWAKYAVPNLADWTLKGYERMLVSHIQPRLGAMRVGEVNAEVIADFRAKLEAAGVGWHSVRQSMVVLQAMYEQAIRWGWVQINPVKAVRKPSAKCERAVVYLAPAEVEKIRNELIARDQLYAATMVSLIAYQGLRTPEELLGVEVRHIRKNTVLVEQRNIVGKIVGGQKVRGFHPRAIDLLDPVRRDVQEYLLATGIRAGVLFRAATASRGGCTTRTTGAGASGRGRGGGGRRAATAV